MMCGLFGATLKLCIVVQAGWPLKDLNIDKVLRPTAVGLEGLFETPSALG